VINIDLIPFFRYIAAIVVFGLSFYFFGILLVGLYTEMEFGGTYAGILTSLWAALPAIVLFSAGIRLMMVQQKRGG